MQDAHEKAPYNPESGRKLKPHTTAKLAHALMASLCLPLPARYTADTTCSSTVSRSPVTNMADMLRQGKKRDACEGRAPRPPSGCPPSLRRSRDFRFADVLFQELGADQPPTSVPAANIAIMRRIQGSSVYCATMAATSAAS